MYWARCVFPWIGSRGVFLLYSLFCFYCFLGVNIFVGVVALMLIRSVTPPLRRHRLQNPKLEVYWRLIPLVVIFSIMIPSIVLLYRNEENLFPDFTIKVIGHQWYWEFEYPILIRQAAILDNEDWDVDGYRLSCDSYGITEDNLKVGDERWVRTDTRLVLPVESPVRLVCTSEDVIHNWNLKGRGTSSDCVPGRLNQTKWYAEASGIFNGLCRELCGVGHSHMPCGAECIHRRAWLEWLQNNIIKPTPKPFEYYLPKWFRYLFLTSWFSGQFVGFFYRCWVFYLGIG